jgi:DNA-3-methyladenine glycosylase II
VIIRPVPPCRLDFTVWALRRRPRNAIDRWDGTSYRRVVMIGRRVTELAIRQSGSSSAPSIVVTANPALRTLADRRQVRSTVDRLLGLHIDLREWYRVAQRDRRLAELADRFRGVKPPRFPTVFEALVNAFACQQLSLVVGLELLNRLAAVCDVRRGSGASAQYAFPAPRDVAARPPADFRAIGFSHQKVRALLALALGLDSGAIELDTLSVDSDADVCVKLRQLRGVGRWTAEYVSLRGLGRLHVFPGDDVGAQKSLARPSGSGSAGSWRELRGNAETSNSHPCARLGFVKTLEPQGSQRVTEQLFWFSKNESLWNSVISVVSQRVRHFAQRTTTRSVVRTQYVRRHSGS